MNKEQARQRIEKLKKVINHHRYLYHVLDRQEISDEALDSLKKELFDLEQKFPDLITPDSPTQRVGGEPLKEFKKVKHPQPMLSFNDAFSKEDMKDWLGRALGLLGKKERKLLTVPSHQSGSEGFYCELKIDGLAIELIFKNGILKTGSTRGDGKIGEDVTQNLKTVEAIPLKIRSKRKIVESLKKEKVRKELVDKIEKFDFKKSLAIRGEVFISKKEFQKINKERKKKNLSPYANPRNLAAGSIRQLDSNITAKRKLDSFAYELITDLGQKTHKEKHQILKALGFKTNPNNQYSKDLSEVFKFHKEWQGKREKLSYEIDGIVIIINSNKTFEKLGVVGKTPRGAIAYKFPGKEATTIIEDIKVQVGRTGALTPVAVLKPVQVGGVTISRATLHNEDEIKRLGIRIGDTVIVGRAGDVIPDVIKVLPDLRTGKEKEFKMPKKCPVCGSKIKKIEAIHYCANPNCFAREKEQFYHFVSRKAFNIDGLGSKIVDQLIEEGLVSDLADLFELEEGDLILLERFAEKSASNLIKAVKDSKKISLSCFIYSLGIRNVGEETAQDLAEQFGTFEKFQKTDLEELKKIEDIGPVVAKSIRDWLSTKKNKELLKKFKKVGIRIISQKSKVKSQKLRGLTFVLTGRLEMMNREKAKKRIRALGGDISSSVSKETDYLVAGEDPGSKYDKAKKLGVKIINEQQFLKMI